MELGLGCLQVDRQTDSRYRVRRRHVGRAAAGRGGGRCSSESGPASAGTRHGRGRP